MPRLNWSELDIQLKSVEWGEGDGLTLCLTPGQAAQLADELVGVLASAAAAEGLSRELRLDLPRGWTIFWKRTPEADSRFLVARPEPGVRVATLLLSPVDAGKLLSSLAVDSSSTALELGGPECMGNFRLRLEVG